MCFRCACSSAQTTRALLKYSYVQVNTESNKHMHTARWGLEHVEIAGDTLHIGFSGLNTFISPRFLRDHGGIFKFLHQNF